MSAKKKAVRSAFRGAVFKRDGYCCRKCGAKPGADELDAHHIIDRSEMPGGGYVPENGITLCKECHVKAEERHHSGTAAPGFSPAELFALIGSSQGEALRASWESV